MRLSPLSNDVPILSDNIQIQRIILNECANTALLSAVQCVVCVCASSCSCMRCVDCEELVPLSSSVAVGGARCMTRRCYKCHASRKKLREWYAKAGRSEEWQQMSIAARREVVVNNKDKGSGRGHKREVSVQEKASCVDSLRLNQDRPFMTKKQLLSLKLSLRQLGRYALVLTNNSLRF